MITNIKGQNVLNFKPGAWNLFRASIFVLGILTTFAFYLSPSAVKAASDTPFPKIHLPCDATNNPEFASLRPYQAAPCGDSNKAYYCSNSLIFTETFNNFPECESQAPREGRFLCKVNKYIPDHVVSVDLADVNEPILGNTDSTKNSENATDQIDDGTKVSEYASWYLNGTINRAEYGANDLSKVVDFAGPIQKIMPQAILENQRIASINNLTKSVPQIAEDETATGKTEAANHNQIVVCYSKPVSLLPSWLTNFLGIGAVGLGKATAIPCYDGNHAKTNGSFLRLSNWDKTDFDRATDAIRNWILQYHLYPPSILDQVIASAGDHWSQKIPPLPWSDQNGQPFKTVSDYQKAYNEWRGQLCAYISVPILGRQLVCIGIPGVTNNDYADLFSYVPLANTTDTHGAEADFIAEIQPAGDTEIVNKSYDTPKSAPLWTAHNTEVKELTDFLNSSYAPKGGENIAVAGDTQAPMCRVVNVSANIGDNTFAGQTHGIIVPNVHYTITQVPCVVHLEDKCHSIIPGHPESGKVCEQLPVVTCDAEINITLPTIMKVAWADEIWQNTVANSESTFRRIYPKVGNGAPVSCIADNPAASGVTYTPHDDQGSGATNFKVQGPTGGNITDNPFLLFPHLGSVYDYFLQGIQQALRPQGFGTRTPVSGQDCTNIACGELPTTLPKTTDSACTLSSTSGLNIPSSLKKILEAAAQTYHVPSTLILGVMFGEGDFNTAGQGTYANGKYDWTDANVKNWATCQKLPNCSSPDTSIVALPDWNTLGRQILPDLQKIDPTKKQADPCNLLDAVYGLAKNLHDNAGGSGSLTGQSCFDITMSSTNPGSCSWNSSQYETAIRVWEIGTEYDAAQNKTCLTTNMSDLQSNGLNVSAGSCGTGIPTNAQDPTAYTQYLCKGGDNCETVSNHSGDTSTNSHNACVWDIATSGGSGNKK